jgi:hypothetical protein
MIPLNANHLFEIIDDIQHDIESTHFDEPVSLRMAANSLRLVVNRIEAKLERLCNNIKKCSDRQIALIDERLLEDLREEEDWEDLEDDDHDDLPF